MKDNPSADLECELAATLGFEMKHGYLVIRSLRESRLWDAMLSAERQRRELREGIERIKAATFFNTLAGGNCNEQIFKIRAEAEVLLEGTK